jgi:hypothetical protein
MPYDERVELYKRIEVLRGCPLIVYITSLRHNASGQMASDAVPYFAKQLLEIPKGEKQVDVLIVSNGGDPTVSWRIISLLRERFERIGVLTSYAAYSAATLLALGANEIVMHPFSNLGPVDPQLTSFTESQKRIDFSAEDLRHFLDFVRTDVGISDQEQLERALELICKDAGAIPIGAAKRSTYLSLSMGEQLLSLHMEDSSQAKTIAETLNRSFFHHGYPVGRREAKQIGLPVVKPNDELEELMWQVWEDFEEEMECDKPFDPLHIVLSDERTSRLLGPVPQVQLPANLPPQVIQQAINQILQQVAIVQVEPIDYELFQASIESTKCKSEFRT